jgi:5-carboxymethyl-2-hydroxymuconic-semialdehyde dehydrogenase
VLRIGDNELHLDGAFGGSRDSGLGREGGSWSFDFFCDVKNVAVRKGSFA